MACRRFVWLPTREDAGEGGWLIRRRYEDMKPWRCDECQQLNEPEWPLCCYCGSWKDEP